MNSNFPSTPGTQNWFADKPVVVVSQNPRQRSTRVTAKNDSQQERRTPPSVVNLSLAIPTYGRNKVLIKTIESILKLHCQPREILVLDQSSKHDRETQQRLDLWQEMDEIRWIRIPKPSIPGAMNRALRIAVAPSVLFIDDDILPRGEFIRHHHEALRDRPERWATVGQIVQPWQEPSDVAAPRRSSGIYRDFDFPFCSTRDQDVTNVMAGNLCVRRQQALWIGGFDEGYVGVAYRFESDFAHRLVKSGGQIRFLGNAGIDHLMASKGGTRSYGKHQSSPSPMHAVGDYYYARKHTKHQAMVWFYSLRRLVKESFTRFHLLRPWLIPFKLVGEVRGYFLAKSLLEKQSSALQDPKQEDQ